MKVSDIMSSPVVVTAESNKVTTVRNLIDRKNIHAIPVLSQEGEIRGIISSIDLAKEKNGEENIGNIMTDFVHVILPSSKAIDAAKMMVKHNVHHLVVMENGDVVGIVSSMDIVRLFAEG